MVELSTNRSAAKRELFFGVRHRFNIFINVLNIEAILVEIGKQNQHQIM